MTHPPLRTGMTVQLRRPHPCGGDRWRITRVGAHIGIACLTCGRSVMLERLLFERRLRRVLETPPPSPDRAPPAQAS